MHHHLVNDTVADVLLQPMQMADVGIADGSSKLDLDGQDVAVVADHDEVDLVVPVPGAQMRNACPGGLGLDTDAQRRQGFKEMPEHGAVLGTDDVSLAVDQGIHPKSHETSGKSGIGQLLGMVSHPW